ncbi:DUF192 domain-containing protein [Candidatus Kaiserbacteria bacterium]|nr:DUF192 domain-containing protein [Candidatus Kaiserbacteria bacterium]
MARQIRYALIVAALVLFASLIYVRLPFDDSLSENAPIDRTSASSTIQIADRTLWVDIADTLEERARGLSGREDVAEDEAMLFIFGEDGRHAFWMKDMRVAIDIVWISRDGVIAHIEQNVAPETYPAVFAPRSEARYVVELSAGWVGRYHVRIGDIVRL